MKTTQATDHIAADETHEADEQGFYVPRCRCGWMFGPVPSMVEVVDVLMEHAFEMARRGPFPKLDHIHEHIERWPHLHHPEGLHEHADPQARNDRSTQEGSSG